MKTRIYFLLALMIIANSIFSQIPNNGFESWTNMGSYSTPDNWGNLNAVTNPAGVYTCLKGTPGNPGTTYLKLISKTVSGMGVQPGVAVSGVLNTSTFQAVSGFAYSGRPESLEGKWQYMASGTDQGYIAVYLTRWNTGLNRRDTIGQTYNALNGMVMSWQNFSFLISYNLGGLPDSAIIIFSASGSTPVNSSYLYVDNLTFTGTTVDLEDQAFGSGLSLLPNPVSKNMLTLDYNNHDLTTDFIEILNIQGKPVIRKILKNQHFPFSIDVSTLRAGEYLIRVGLQIGTIHSKFIKQ